MTSATPGFQLTAAGMSMGALLRDTWHSRRLIAILARKDFYVKYRRATFGLLWAAVVPLLQALVLAFVVGKFVNFQVPGNRAVFMLSGTVAWSTFSGILAAGSTSIVDGTQLSTKIYFPRLVLPMAVVVTNAYGLGISVAVLLGTTVLTGTALGPQALLMIPGALLVLLLGASFSLVLSALHVYFRDVRYVVASALLVWMYLTPVIYPLTAIGNARRFIELNPMTGIVELFRAATVGADANWEITLVWTGCWIAVLTIVGLILHRRFDRVFGDLL